MNLVEFLRQRLDEDEATAREAWAPNWPDPLSWFSEEEMVGRQDELADIEGFATAGSKADARHVARHDPARVLADVAARRAIVDAYDHATQSWQEAIVGHDVDSLPVRTARLIALEFAARQLAALAADHPDYDPAWQPAVTT
jgi:hypothetical protein